MTTRPACSLCGAPTRARLVDGVPALACVSCGAVVLEHRGLQQLVRPNVAVAEPAPLSAHIPQSSPQRAPGQMGIVTPLPPEPQPPTPRYAAPSDVSVLDAIQSELAAERTRAVRTQRLTLIAGLITCLIVVAVAIPLSYVVYRAVRIWSYPPPLPIEAPAPEPGQST